MAKRLLVLICFLLVAAGGESPVRLDMSSEESYRETLHAMKAQLADEQEARLDRALAIVRLSVLQEMDRRTLFAALRGESSRAPKAILEALKKKLHGKTAQEVFELAGTRLAASEQETLREMLVENSADLGGTLIDGMIAEKRASIEATDDPALKEKGIKELQSLLKLRGDSTDRRLQSDRGRYQSGIYRPPGDQFSTRPVAINIGDAGYVIPRNFVSHIAWKGSKHNHQHVVLHALWPGMEPRTEENKREWRYYDDVGIRVADWNAVRQIRIILAPPGYLASDAYERFQNAFRFSNVGPAPGTERYGLTPYPKRAGKFSTTYYVAESTAYRSPQNTPMVLECEEATQGIMKLFPVKIRCEVQYVLEGGVGLYYQFYATSLKPIFDSGGRREGLKAADCLGSRVA